MTDKERLRIIDELAEDKGLTPEDFLLSLVKAENDSKMETFKNYPEEVAKRLTMAEKEKSEHRKAKYEQTEREYVNSQIAEFIRNFPGVSPEEIPEKVWNEVKSGVSLSHAYALWKIREQNSPGENPEDINTVNSGRSLPVVNDRSEPLDFTREDVEKMSPNAIKGNYKKILNSMKRWKF
ncbi:MAG: hypothetical protein GX148_08745 [Clostridiales bacterium]|jgi:hypothetical protein|nr:hypothetical protein [Clostridiales bacterium]